MTWLSQITDALANARRNEEKRKVLAQIDERLKDHDFSGESMEDRWVDYLCPDAFDYLTSQEIELLEALGHSCEPLGDDELMRVGEAEHIVMKRFIIWLAARYGVEPSDIGDVPYTE